MSFVDEIRDAIALRRASLCLGAGVTVAATGRRDLSWPGLLQRGMDKAVALNLAPTAAWAAKVTSDIEYGTEHGDAAALAAAAAMITSALGGRDSEAYAAWLREEFGSLDVTEPGLIHSLADIGAPLLTTNYDCVVEEVTGFDTVTWLDSARMQSVMTGRATRVVGHLHGAWRQPDSVVLDHFSYSQILANSGAQALQRATHAMQSVIFVGFGAGLDDPNFDSLRRWYAQTLGVTPHRHYRLCLDSEAKELRAQHAQENIEVVPYGANYGDLEGFLRELAVDRDAGASKSPTVHIRDAVDNGRQVLVDRVREESLLRDFFADVDSREPVDLVIRPVLLPVAQEQFSSLQSLDKDVRPRRSDPDSDAASSEAILVASEEKVGLTTALEWLLHARSEHDDLAVPMLIDFRSVQKGLRPLEAAIRRQALAGGLIARKNDKLPPLILGIDNFALRPDVIADRAIKDLCELDLAFLVIGCRQGEEGDVRAALGPIGRRVVLRYVGRMNHGDMHALASLASPSKATALADRALQVINREHLPRTPFTFGLLLTVLMHGESYMSASSGTALLDAYVNLLMGRGDPHEDARFSLDALERSDILANLAEVYVRQRVGSMSQKDFTSALSDYFEQVGWKENAHAVFDNFLKRRLLIVRGDQVAFAQSSYLHLFAAKRAATSPEFLQMLMGKPLYYAPILQHYAALTRNDAQLLSALDATLNIESWDGVAPSVHFVEAREEALEAPENLPELVDELFDKVEGRTEGGRDLVPYGDDGDDSSTEAASSDWLDRVNDADAHPFPFTDTEDAPASTKVAALASLVSTVLRDSELVRDIELKQRVLRKCLVLWGRLVDALEADAAFKEVARELVEMLAEGRVSASQKKRDDFIDDFMDMVVPLTAFGVMSQNLSSRKLIIALEGILADDEFVRSPHGSVMGALLAFDIQTVGWAQQFNDVQERHPHIPIAENTMVRMAFLAYLYQSPSAEDLRALEDYLVANWARRFRFSSEVAKKDSVATFKQRLVRMRRLSGSKLETGETMFGGAIEGSVSAETSV